MLTHNAVLNSSYYEKTNINISININMYRVLKDKSATLPQNDPDIKLHPHNRKFPHPKLNAYGMIALQ
jgi:hypothetical protein